MEDSTIEFLQARLLSERSVSKSARQRADELARRVAELEEQLRIVSVQTRRAEKATADVLAILENNGVSAVSEELDSSSDQDMPFESNMDNVSTKEEERSVGSKGRRKEEELSCSEDFSSLSGRSLSWKGRKSASHSPEKYKDSLVRRHNMFSSPKHWQGKLCRKIRHREPRLVAEEPKSDDVKAGSPVNELVTSPEVNDNQSKSEKDMEKALEHQAQLIDRYEAMEKAQREWEEKFRENNSSTPIWKSVVQNHFKEDQYGAKFRSLFKVRVGNGGSTRFWFDSWALDSPLKVAFSRLFVLSLNKNGKLNELGEFRSWHIQMRRNLSDWELDQFSNLLAIIHNITLSHEMSDSLVRRGNGEGIYTVNSCVKSCCPVLTADSFGVIGGKVVLGGILRVEDGSVVGSFQEAIGLGPPILIELMAIKKGLTFFALIQQRFKERLIVESTSKLAVDWVKNNDRCPYVYVDFVKDIVTKLRGLKDIIRWVARSANVEADNLVKAGIG
ncbi:rab9 effector protein with kelch motifs-like [Hibiscus syriacus]|uniref:Rab9 effector protein with kelch motifs-like n=1 Tax=Hibiscus syriacus TaxID=106335 RepID=A0A6A2XGJ3_HIBSY|nr:rab9 effector protein with kelch motifs-like [Hibiscus syriacus]